MSISFNMAPVPRPAHCPQCPTTRVPDTDLTLVEFRVGGHKVRLWLCTTCAWLMTQQKALHARQDCNERQVEPSTLLTNADVRGPTSVEHMRHWRSNREHDERRR